jgi:GNAT superfamily N-acetyltransferase
VRIRGSTRADAGAIAELWTVAYVEEGEGGRVLPYAEADYFEIAERTRVLLAMQQETVIGVVALAAPGVKGVAVALGCEAELSRLVVASSARRQGIGRVLLLRCEELARAEGWGAIALWSRRYQTAAHRLYESLG